MSHNDIPESNTFRVDPDRLREAAAGGAVRYRGGQPHLGRNVATVDSPDLGWIWQLPPAQLQRFLSAAVSTPDTAAYWADLRRLALHLIIDSPAGPPNSAAQFLHSCTPEVLARHWGGSIDRSAAWTGAPGYDAHIGAVLEGKYPTLLALGAEFTNLFRSWDQDPHKAIHTRTAVFGDNQ